MNRLITSIGLCMASVITLAATPTVSNVTAKQRYPWNGMVDIMCTVSGISGTTNDLKFSIAAVNSGNIYTINQFWVVKNGTNSTDRKVHTNGTYHLVWDSKVDFDNQICSNMVMRVNLVIHDKVQLWANGPYWATTNIGAENPEDYGYYFWWGDTVGYKYEGNAWVATDGSSQNCQFGYLTSISWQTIDKSIATLKSEGWIVSKDGTNVLAPEHDAAHVHWGGNWRMPTRQELNDLNSNCDWTWTTMNGVNGYVVKGKGAYASASIFLPCAGMGYGETSPYDAGSYGCYWSSVPASSDYDYNYDAWILGFESGYHNYYCNLRCWGHSVRPVQGFTQ